MTNDKFPKPKTLADKTIKDDRIVVRIDTHTKEMFTRLCEKRGINPSDYLRNFIVKTTNDGFKDLFKEQGSNFILDMFDNFKIQIEYMEKVQKEILKMKESLSISENNEDNLK